MKGVIFNVVGEIIEELYDADTWDDLLVAADVDGAYTALGDYADDELVAIVAAAAAATSSTAEDVLRLVGRHALPKLAARIPATFTDAPNAFAFIRRVNDIIHPEVLKLYPNAVPPAFEFEDVDGALLVRYRSARNLPALAEGLLLGVGDRYDENVTVERVDSADGDVTALFRVTADAGP